MALHCPYQWHGMCKTHTIIDPLRCVITLRIGMFGFRILSLENGLEMRFCVPAKQTCSILTSMQGTAGLF